MYEFTHSGFWFRWESLDKTGRRLLVASCGASAVAVLPLAQWLGEIGYRIGYRLGSGGLSPAGAAPEMAEWAIWWLIGFGALSAVIWWRFSLRQDEMFNRVQNWALAMSGAVTALCLVVWSLLALVGRLPPVTALPTVILYIGSLLAFWYVAYRRWAA